MYLKLETFFFFKEKKIDEGALEINNIIDCSSVWSIFKDGRNYLTVSYFRDEKLVNDNWLALH